ncbi:hypothetical protein GEV33_013352 [Tenebrio molitor]|uniref:Uncharacterized protein n=1 Tax=Tenebrio molitor TaxID=7067 RepID=A0A8J6H0D4_TENMO|nr:hypothetical protein GEV33_013352 [Tenebrio molitor]
MFDQYMHLVNLLEQRVVEKKIKSLITWLPSVSSRHMNNEIYKAKEMVKKRQPKDIQIKLKKQAVYDQWATLPNRYALHSATWRLRCVTFIAGRSRRTSICRTGRLLFLDGFITVKPDTSATLETTVTVEVQSAQTATKGTASHCENRRLLADAPQTKRDRGATRPLHPELRTSRSREKARVNTTCVLRGEDDGWIFPTTYPTGGGASGRIGGGTLYAGNIWALGGFSKSMVSSHSHYNAVRTLPHEEYHRTAVPFCRLCRADRRHDPPHHMLARLTLHAGSDSTRFEGLHRGPRCVTHPSLRKARGRGDIDEFKSTRLPNWTFTSLHPLNKGVSESRGQRRRGQWIPVQGHYQCTPLDGHRAHLRPEHRRRQVGLSQKRGGRRPRSSMNVGNVETVAVSTATELEIKRCSTINRRIKQDRLLRQEVHEWRFAFEAWVELLAEQRSKLLAGICANTLLVWTASREDFLRSVDDLRLCKCASKEMRISNVALKEAFVGTGCFHGETLQRLTAALNHHLSNEHVPLLLGFHRINLGRVANSISNSGDEEMMFTRKIEFFQIISNRIIRIPRVPRDSLSQDGGGCALGQRKHAKYRADPCNKRLGVKPAPPNILRRHVGAVTYPARSVLVAGNPECSPSDQICHSKLSISTTHETATISSQKMWHDYAPLELGSCQLHETLTPTRLNISQRISDRTTNATPKIFANDVTYKPILRICKIVTSDARGSSKICLTSPRGRAAEAFHSLFSHTDGKFGMGAVRMGAEGRSGGTGVRTRDLSNAKWRARRLATVLGCGLYKRKTLLPQFYGSGNTGNAPLLRFPCLILLLASETCQSPGFGSFVIGVARELPGNLTTGALRIALQNYCQNMYGKITLATGPAAHTRSLPPIPWDPRPVQIPNLIVFVRRTISDSDRVSEVCPDLQMAIRPGGRNVYVQIIVSLLLKAHLFGFGRAGNSNTIHPTNPHSLHEVLRDLQTKLATSSGSRRGVSARRAAAAASGGLTGMINIDGNDCISSMVINRPCEPRIPDRSCKPHVDINQLNKQLDVLRKPGIRNGMNSSYRRPTDKDNRIRRRGQRKRRLGYLRWSSTRAQLPEYSREVNTNMESCMELRPDIRDAQLIQKIKSGSASCDGELWRDVCPTAEEECACDKPVAGAEDVRIQGHVGLPRTEEKIHDGAESPDQRRTKEPKRDELVRNVPPVLRNHVKRPDPTTMKRRFIHYGKNVFGEASARIDESITRPVLLTQLQRATPSRTKTNWSGVVGLHRYRLQRGMVAAAVDRATDWANFRVFAGDGRNRKLGIFEKFGSQLSIKADQAAITPFGMGQLMPPTTNLILVNTEVNTACAPPLDRRSSSGLRFPSKSLQDSCSGCYQLRKSRHVPSDVKERKTSRVAHLTVEKLRRSLTCDKLIKEQQEYLYRVKSIASRTHVLASSPEKISMDASPELKISSGLNWSKKVPRFDEQDPLSGRWVENKPTVNLNTWDVEGVLRWYRRESVSAPVPEQQCQESPPHQRNQSHDHSKVKGSVLWQEQAGESAAGQENCVRKHRQHRSSRAGEAGASAEKEDANAGAHADSGCIRATCGLTGEEGETRQPQEPLMQSVGTVREPAVVPEYPKNRSTDRHSPTKYFTCAKASRALRHNTAGIPWHCRGCWMVAALPREMHTLRTEKPPDVEPQQSSERLQVIWFWFLCASEGRAARGRARNPRLRISLQWQNPRAADNFYIPSRPRADVNDHRCSSQEDEFVAKALNRNLSIMKGNKER